MGPIVFQKWSPAAQNWHPGPRRRRLLSSRLKCCPGAAEAPYMAETVSGPEPSTTVGNSSVDSPLRARLPQAQAENILASLAGRSSASAGPVRTEHLPPGPTGAPRPGPERAAVTDHRALSHEPGPGPAGAQPHRPTGSPKPLGAPGPTARAGHVAPGAAAAAGEDDLKGSGGARRASRQPDVPRPISPYRNDILPARPPSRFRFRLSLARRG